MTTTRHGKTVSADLEAIIIATANRQLDAMVEKGFGMQGNGRYSKGAPVRTTVSNVHNSVTRSVAATPAEVEAVMDSHFERSAPPKRGNTYFYGRKAV